MKFNIDLKLQTSDSRYHQIAYEYYSVKSFRVELELFEKHQAVIRGAWDEEVARRITKTGSTNKETTRLKVEGLGRVF